MLKGPHVVVVVVVLRKLTNCRTCLYETIFRNKNFQRCGKGIFTCGLQACYQQTATTVSDEFVVCCCKGKSYKLTVYNTGGVCGKKDNILKSKLP